MVLDRNHGPLRDEVLVHVFREIMSACLAQQEPLKIGYLGPEGTFSQQATDKHFGRSAVGVPMATIEEVFQEVGSGSADFGVVPVENSGQGTVQVTLDMFLTSDLKICGEVELRVHQYLLSRSGPYRGYRADLFASAVVSRRPKGGSAATCRAWKKSPYRATRKARDAHEMPTMPPRSPANPRRTSTG